METYKIILLILLIIGLILIPVIVIKLSSKDRPKIVSKKLQESIDKENEYIKNKYDEKTGN